MGEAEVGEEARCLAEVEDGDTENNNISKAELKRDRHCLKNEEAESNQSPSKKQAKEVSNDDIRSEVSNPVISPKENRLAFQDITSEPSELANGGSQAECGEVTSAACSGNLSSEETFSNEERSGIGASQIDNDKSDDVLTSRVVLEIPEHAASSGIRKITFKFSKRKEDYNTHLVPEGFDSLSSYGGSREVPGPFSSSMVDVNVEFPEYSYWKGGYTETRKSHVRAPNLELKVSEKVVPTNVKKLFSTRILDGARVKYVFSSSEVCLDSICFTDEY